MQKMTGLVVAILLLSGCADREESTASHPVDPIESQKTAAMKSYISILEIPASDMARAIDFYEGILEVKIEPITMPGMEMGLLPYENQIVTVVLVKAEGYEPSASGAVAYLNGGDQIEVILDRVEKKGGEILVPKTPHADESGYFALFLDSEGNRMGLHAAD